MKKNGEILFENKLSRILFRLQTIRDIIGIIIHVEYPFSIKNAHFVKHHPISAYFGSNGTSGIGEY
jgi:hypothetical protein